MRRVVITGLGIVSSIGNDAEEVAAVAQGRPLGHQLRARLRRARLPLPGARASPQIDVAEHIDKRQLRFMGDGAAFAFLAMQQAIADAGLEESDVSNPRTGLIAGSGGPSTRNLFEAHQTVIEKGSPKRMGPFMVTRCMSSTVSACLATPFRIKGINYSITSACSTSAHCIGAGVEQIQWGKQDIVFAGGGEELDWTLSCLFDAMGAMSTKYNDEPDTRLARLRRRPRRLRHRRRRRHGGAGGAGARPRPRREDLRRGHRLRRHLRRPRHGRPLRRRRRARHAPGARDAARRAASVGYINAHGTSTPVGDVSEVEAVRRVFGEGRTPPISSTKSMTGHSQGATGAQEAIYCLLMLRDDFIAPSINVETLDPGIRPGEIATARVDDAGLDTVMTNSFGFGGTNASLLLSRLEG